MLATNKSVSNVYSASLAISTSEDFNSFYDEDRPRAITQLLVWIQNTGVLSSLTYSISSSTIGRDKSNNVIRFSLSDNYRSYFPLLRGFLSMGTRFSIRADVKIRAFIVEITEDQVQSFEEYIKYIVALLKAEINFKKSLKRVIAFEKEIAGQQKALHATFYNSLNLNAAAL